MILQSFIFVQAPEFFPSILQKLSTHFSVDSDSVNGWLVRLMVGGYVSGTISKKIIKDHLPKLPFSAGHVLVPTSIQIVNDVTSPHLTPPQEINRLYR